MSYKNLPEGCSEARMRAAAFVMVVLSAAFVVAVLAVVRLGFIFKFASCGLFAENAGSIPLFLFNALRYDAQVAAYASIPLLAAALVVAVRPAAAFRPAMRFSRIWLAVATVIVGLVDVADIHWYNNFSRHFDIVAFDFFDEEPSVLIKGIVAEAPVLLMIVAGFALFFAAWSVGRWLVSLSLLVSLRLKTWVAPLVAVVVVGVSARGSLGTFTLRPEDVYVSPSAMFNDCVPNGIFMLKKAWSERKKQFKMRPDADILADAGYDSEHAAAAACLGVDDRPGLTADSALIAATPAAPLCEGYDVVLIVCESWGRKLMDYDGRYGMDLLCSMRKHLGDDLLWLNFLSATNGTIDAVEAFTTSCPYPRLFTSRYRDTRLPLSAARVWADAGYSTHFVSGIEISWRNLMEVLPCQGFDDVTGKFEIMSRMPEAEVNHTWGVYDHSMLAYLLDRIREPSIDGKPRFFMALTSTNHTPFEFPDGYDLPDFKIPADGGAFAIDDKGVIEDYLRGYQYTSRAIGDFMSALKASPAGRRTIVAITGDHNTRLVLPYPEGENPMLKYSVPFYLYVPGAPANWRERFCGRYGSHRDIVPTLACLTLPHAEYMADGQNLLADSVCGGTCGVNVALRIFSPDADSLSVCRRLAATDALKQIWFKRQFEK